MGQMPTRTCTTFHPLYARFTKRFGASFSETTMRPSPSLAAEHRRPHQAEPVELDLGFGRIVTSELKAPNVLVNLV